jgi:hypothetical protein
LLTDILGWNLARTRYYYKCSTARDCPVRKVVWTDVAGQRHERVYDGPHNHAPVSARLSETSRLEYEHELRSGKSVAKVYKEAVAGAEDPTDSSTVASKSQLRYMKRKVNKEHLPSRDVCY